MVLSVSRTFGIWNIFFKKCGFSALFLFISLVKFLFSKSVELFSVLKKYLTSAEIYIFFSHFLEVEIYNLFYLILIFCIQITSSFQLFYLICLSFQYFFRYLFFIFLIVFQFLFLEVQAYNFFKFILIFCKQITSSFYRFYLIYSFAQQFFGTYFLFSLLFFFLIFWWYKQTIYFILS